MSKSFYRCLPVWRLHSPQNLYSFFCQSVSIIWTVGCFSIILNQGCCTKSVQSLFSKCFSAVLSISNTIKCIDKLNDIMNTNPFIACFTPEHIWFHSRHCQNHIATYISQLCFRHTYSFQKFSCLFYLISHSIPPISNHNLLLNNLCS